jgi:hypothetical protein
MRKERLFIFLLAPLWLTFAGITLSQAQVASRISYQGVLKEGGSPVTGSRDLTFKLYTTTDCSGTALQTINKSGVPVSNGVFSTALDVTATNFNGQALYIQMAVGGTNIGCQEILPVPYALSLRPGTQIENVKVSGSLRILDDNGNFMFGLDSDTSSFYMGGHGLAGFFTIKDENNFSCIDLDSYFGYVWLSKNAGTATETRIGQRFRDNGIVAWAKVELDGDVGADHFGLTSVTHPATGRYDVTLQASAASAATLIPIAIAERDSQPNSAATVRIVSINQTGVNTFSVYINDGTWAPVNNDFVFMVTAR